MFTAVFVNLDEGVWIMARMTVNNAKYFSSRVIFPNADYSGGFSDT